MRKIDDIEYTVEISCYFLTKWHEDRLVLHEDILREKFEEESEVGGEGEEQWYPIDLEFVSKVCNGDVQKVLPRSKSSNESRHVPSWDSLRAPCLT